MRVTRWHLAMTDPGQLRPAREPEPAPEVRRVVEPFPAWSRFLYEVVGGPWHWTDRLGWSLEVWEAFLSRPGVETWVAWHEGTPAGYYELEHRAAGEAEILYFGLVPRFIGRGWGGHLLTHAVRRAWALGAGRVLLNTCSLDHPAALDAYRARGFLVVREEVFDRPAVAREPESRPGPEAT